MKIEYIASDLEKQTESISGSMPGVVSSPNSPLDPRRSGPAGREIGCEVFDDLAVLDPPQALFYDCEVNGCELEFQEGEPDVGIAEGWACKHCDYFESEAESAATYYERYED